MEQSAVVSCRTVACLVMKMLVKYNWTAGGQENGGSHIDGKAPHGQRAVIRK